MQRKLFFVHFVPYVEILLSHLGGAIAGAYIGGFAYMLTAYCLMEAGLLTVSFVRVYHDAKEHLMFVQKLRAGLEQYRSALATDRKYDMESFDSAPSSSVN